jgi:hypothetical protein
MNRANIAISLQNLFGCDVARIGEERLITKDRLEVFGHLKIVSK